MRYRRQDADTADLAGILKAAVPLPFETSRTTLLSVYYDIDEGPRPDEPDRGSTGVDLGEPAEEAGLGWAVLNDSILVSNSDAVEQGWVR